jgi:hypothetical protein
MTDFAEKIRPRIVFDCQVEKIFIELTHVPSVDIKSWDIQKLFIVYQTFALLQIVSLTIVTLTSLFGITSSFNVFLLPTCFDHQKTDSVNNYQLFNWENKQYHSI